MTKPKTVRELLAEANKLARERGMGEVVGFIDGVSVYGDDDQQIRIDIGDTGTELRCLIAALREVPVRKRKR